MTTGIIRRIDELGRIVIPKEIRKKLRIDNGESLEILIEDDNIILKKYSPVESLNDVVNKYVDIFSQVIKCNIIVVDRKKVIGVSSNIKKQYQDKDITEFTLRSIDRRDNFVERQKKEFNFGTFFMFIFHYIFSISFDSYGTITDSKQWKVFKPINY